MAVGMSLTGLAIAVATPLSPAQRVSIMDTLSIIYCTLGGIGSALFAFYYSHPEILNPTAATDQVLPLFHCTRIAAAQSTDSTSLNSIATSIVTEFLQPLDFCRSNRGYLRAAKILTLTVGILGTILALFFVDPEIKSLMLTPRVSRRRMGRSARRPDLFR